MHMGPAEVLPSGLGPANSAAEPCPPPPKFYSPPGNESETTCSGGLLVRRAIFMRPNEKGVLILRRLHHAIRVIIVEHGKLYLFVPAAHPWLSGHMHLGLIWAQTCIVVSSFFCPSPKIDDN